MSAQTAKKKRIGSRRRVGNQNNTSAADEFHITDSTSVAQSHIPEENTKSLNVLANPENSQSESHRPPSPELTGNRRKLGSSRRNKGGQHVKESETESYRNAREEVEENIRGNETLETTQISLAIQPERQEELREENEHDISATCDSSLYLAITPDFSSEVKSSTTINCPEADLECLMPKSEKLQAHQDENATEYKVVSDSCKLEETMVGGLDKSDTLQSEEVKENAHLVSISELTSVSILSCPTVDQQLIDQSNSREMPEEELPNLYSVTEKEKKKRNNDTELLRQVGNLQDNYVVSESHVESVVMQFSTIPEVTTDKSSPRADTELESSVEQAELSLPKQELPTDEEQKYMFNLSEVRGVHQSEDAVNKVHEQEVNPTEMPQNDSSFESVTHDATENREIISGNLIYQAEVSDTYQSELIVKSTGDSATKQEDSNPDDKHDDHPTKERNFETLDHRNEDYHDTKKPQISDVERVDTALGQVYEGEGRLEDDIKPSTEQTVHQEKEGLFSEMEESESSLQTLQSEIHAPLDSQPQDISVRTEEQTHTGFNPLGNRRKMGSSRRNKGRQHAKDSVAESYHKPTEEVVGNTWDNEPLETTNMSLTIETTVQETSLETMLEGMDTFDTAHTEEVSDQVKENAHLFSISELNSSTLHPNPTVDQQMIDRSTFREMPDEERCNLHSVTEKEDKERDEDTELLRPDGNLQDNYLVSESHLKSEDTESFITPEISTDKHSPREHVPKCSAEQADFSSLKQELPTDKEQNEIFNLSEVRGVHQSEDAVNKVHEQEVNPTEMPQNDSSFESVTHDATENREIISGNLIYQAEVSDTYQSELIVKSTGDSATKQEDSNPDDKHDDHPTKERNFETLDHRNENYHDTKKPQISDVERVDTALGQVYEIDVRVEDDIKPSTEQTVHQEKEGLFSEMEESKSSLQTLQSEIHAPLDSQPQDISVRTEEQTHTGFNPLGNRRKMGSSRRNKGRQHAKDSVAESYHEHKEEVAESTSGIEALETTQMLLTIEKMSQEELSQGSEHDIIMPATHDSSLYSATMPGYSSEVQKPTTTNYPETDLESLIPKSKNLQQDHDERETDFKVEVSDKSVGATLEGMDKSDTLQSQEVSGADHLEDVVNKVDEQEVKPTDMQEMPQIGYSSESVTHDATENREIISGNLIYQAEVSDTYQSELIVKSTGDSATKQEDSNPDDKHDDHPTKERNFETLDHRNEDYHDTKKPQISNVERVDTALGQVYEGEGRLEDDIKPSTEQTVHQEKEGLFSEMEESKSSLQTLQSEIHAPLDSQPQDISVRTEEQTHTGFNPLGNRRKMGSSRRNKGRQHAKDSVAESYHEHKEEVAESTSGIEALETTQMLLTIEKISQEELSQGSEHDIIMPATHDSSLYSATMPGYSSEVQKPTTTNYPETDLESLIPKSKNLQQDHDERETDFKVEVSDKSVGATLEGMDKSDTLQSQEVSGADHLEDVVNKPSTEQTVHQEKEGLFSEMEESESSLQTLQSEIHAPLDSQPQDISVRTEEQTHTGFNPLGNRRKMGSSRRNKGRQHAKDSVAESYHKPTEEVVGNTWDNEPLETTNMSLTIETTVQETSLETMLEGMDTFDTAHTEEVSDQVKENAHLFSISELNSSTLHPNPTVDQQMIDRSTFREMPDEERCNLHSVTEKEDKERDEDTELLRPDGNLQDNYLVSESHLKSEDTESFITPEISTDKHSPREHVPKCSAEQADFSSLKQELPTDKEQNEIFNLSEVRGVHQSEDAVNKVHEQEVNPTEMPQNDSSFESVTHDATENREIISGNLIYQAEVSDTYQSELIVKSTGDSATKQEDSNPDDKHDDHPTKERNFETLDHRNEDYHDTKKPQISDVERVDTALGQVYEGEGRLEDDIKPSTEQTVHQEKEGLFSEMEESESSLQTLQSEIHAPLDSQPQDISVRTEEQTHTGFNPLGNRRKMGSSRRNKGRQHAKDSVAESYHEHKEEVAESTSGIEALETTQMLLTIEKMSQEELSQGSEHDIIMPATHDSSLYSATMPGYSSEVQKPTTTNYPETDLESLIPKSKNLQQDHDERETDFKVEVSDKSVGATLEGMDKSDTLQSQEVSGADHLEDVVNKVDEQEVKPTDMQEMPQIGYSSESVTHDATENREIISGNLIYQAEVSDTYQSELIVKSTGDSATKQEDSNPDDKHDDHPTKERNFETLDHRNEDYHDTKKPQISNVERVDTALGQVYEGEGRLEDDIKPSTEQTVHQEKEGLFSEMEESKSSLQTLQSEIHAPLDSQPQDISVRTEEQTHTGFNPLGNRRKMGSSRRNKGRQHAKDSVAESYHEHKEEVAESTSGIEALETTQMLLTIEKMSQEELSQGSEHDIIMPATHDSSLYSATMPGYSSEVQKPTTTNYPETDLESLIPKSKNLQQDHDERETDFKVEVSDKSVGATLEGMDKSDTLQSQEVSGADHLEDVVNKVDEQEVKPTDMQEMPQIGYSSESVTHDATENREIISGNLIYQAEVSDTYQSELIVKSTGDSATKQEDSNPDDKHDDHPTKERNFETLDHRNEDYHDTKKPQISDVERVDTALGQVYEGEGRLEDDIKPSTEQTVHQEKEGLFSEMEESKSSLQTLQSEIHAPLDSQPQDISVRTEEQTHTGFNPLGNRRKMGSSRRNKGRQHAKDSVAESYHEHKEEVAESTSGIEALETTQMLLTIEKMSQEELSQGSEHDIIMPATHDSSLYSATMPGYSSEVQKPTTTNYPETDLESLIPKSKNLQQDHDERETDFKVEVSDKSVGATLEGMDKSDTLQSQEVSGADHLEDVVNKVDEQEVKPTDMQEMPQIGYSSESVTHDATENREIISGNLIYQAEVSDTYQSELIVKSTGDSATKQEDSNPDDKHDDHPTKERNFETLDHRNEDYHDTKKPQISDVERVDTALGQVYEGEGRLEDDIKPSTEQTVHQEKEGLFSEMEESKSSLQTLQSEIHAPLDSQPQDISVRTEEQTHTGFNPLGNRRKMGSSRRNKGRQHAKDSVAESYHEHKEEVAESTSGIEALETTQMLLTIEKMSQEELSQGSEHDIIMPATHDSSLYSATMPGYSSEVQKPTTTNYPETDLESLIPKSKNLQQDHDERETDFKVEVSDKSVGATLEGMDKSDTLQSQEVSGADHLENVVNKPSTEQTVHQEKEGLFSEMEESESSLQTLQSEIHAPLDSQPQDISVRTEEQTHTGFNPLGNRRKMGSSRRNKGRQHAKDSVAESYHKPTEEVVGNTWDNEPLETTQMLLTIETTVQETSLETMLEGMDTFDTAHTEDVSDQVKENAHVGEHTEIVCNVEQDDFSSSKEELSANEEQKDHESLSQVRGVRHSENSVNEVHEEEVKTTQMQERAQMDYSSVKESESSLQTLQSEMNAPLDSQPLDNSQGIKEQTHTGFKPTGNRKKLASSRRNKGRQHFSVTETYNEPKEEERDDETLETTKMSLGTETVRKEESKEQIDLNLKPSKDIRKFRITVNDEEKKPEDDTILSQYVMDNSTIVKTDKDVNEEEKNVIKEPENLSQLTGNYTFKMDSIQSPEVSVWKDDSDIQNISHHDDNVIFDVLEQEETNQVQNALSCDKDSLGQEINMQQTNDEIQTVGDVMIKDYNTEAESSINSVEVSGQDKVGDKFDPTKKDCKAQEMNASQEITHAPHNKTDTLAPFDIGFEENFKAEPAVVVSEEGGLSTAVGPCNSQQGIQEKIYLDNSENLQDKSKQKRRKMGSTRRTQLNRNPEGGMDNKEETKESDFNIEADMRNLDKIKEVEELPMIVTAAVSQNENATPSQSPVYKEQQETNEISTVCDMAQKLQSSTSDLSIQSNMISDIDDLKALLHEQSASHNEEAVNPIKFVQVVDVRESERNVTSQLDHKLDSNTEDATNSGITGGSFVPLCETTQSTQNDEERPESVNVIQDQALKSAEAPVVAVADFEIVKSVARGGAGEEHKHVQASIQELNNVNEGAHNKNFEMKNASPNLYSTNKRRKMGSTRKNLGSRTKGEDLHQEQEVDNDITETTTNVGDVKIESFSGIKENEIQLHIEHKDSDSEHKKEKVFETVECSHTGESHFKPPAHQTFVENPASHGQLVETEQQLPASCLPAIPSTSPKHDVMSESASGGKRRKMGSHRKSHGHQNNDNQTTDRITDTQKGMDVRSKTDKSTFKTTEEKSLGLDKISEVEESNKKASANVSTSKAEERSRPVSEKTPERGTPVQHPYAAIRPTQEIQKTFSLAGSSRGADLRSNRYNVMMVGDSSVGKTSFIKRAQSGKFSLDLPSSVGLDTCMWNVVVDGKPVELQLWDTAGQERFHSITRQIFHKAQAFLLMYDITSSQSFSAVSYWATSIQEGAAENVAILLVGNKSDHSGRQVKTQQGEILAKEYNFEFLECSAATGENVIQSLETVARMLSQKVDTREEATVLHKELQQKKSSGCC